MNQKAAGQFLNDIVSGQTLAEADLAKQLIENLRDLPEPIGDIIDLMFCARKGLDAQLMQHLNKKWTEEEIKDYLEILEKLAIVKNRLVKHGTNKRQNCSFMMRFTICMTNIFKKTRVNQKNTSRLLLTIPKSKKKQTRMISSRI